MFALSIKKCMKNAGKISETVRGVVADHIGMLKTTVLN